MRSLECVRCGERLPLNSLGAEWPYGRVLSLDEPNELCWAVCADCDSWTLAPEGTAADLRKVISDQPDSQQRQLTPTLTEYCFADGQRIVTRHPARPRHERVAPALSARRRRRAAVMLTGLLAVGVLGSQLLRTDALWPYVALGGLTLLVTLAIQAHRGRLRLASSSTPDLVLTRESGALLRWLGGGWSLEVGDATPGGTLRALGRARFMGPDALRVLQQVIAFRLADGAADSALQRAEATIVDRGNPFLEPKRRDRWGAVLIVDKLDEVDLLALELAVQEALGEHQVAARGRRLEARFKSEATLAAIIRREID